MRLGLSAEDQALIDRIKQRVYRDPQHATTMSKHGYLSNFYPPVTYAQIQATEEAIGFPLPALIREIYLQVGNGGFGPGYGIIGLEGGYEIDDETLIRTYFLGQGYTGWKADYDDEDDDDGDEDEVKEPIEWGKSFMIYAEWGCNTYTVIDCSPVNPPVYCMEVGDLSFIPPRCFVSGGRIGWTIKFSRPDAALKYILFER